MGQNPLASNIAWGKQAGVDPRTMGIYNQSQAGFPTWAAEGGRIGRAYGGIMDTATGRRAYGLGSIFKKIGRAAKKVFKSPIGKAAMVAGLGFGANAGWFSKMGLGNMGKGWAGSLKTAAQDKDWLGKLLLTKDDNFSPWKLGIMGASALPFFMGGKDEDEDDKFDYMGAKNKYADEIMRIKRGVMAGSLNPNEFSYLPSNYTYTGAEGGRAGFDNGGFTMDDTLAEEDRKVKES